MAKFDPKIFAQTQGGGVGHTLDKALIWRCFMDLPKLSSLYSPIITSWNFPSHMAQYVIQCEVMKTSRGIDWCRFNRFFKSHSLSVLVNKLYTPITTHQANIMIYQLWISNKRTSLFM